MMSKTTDFGAVEKILTPTFNPDGSINKEIETLALTKKQAIASGARLDNTMLMQVINRVEELEKKQNLPVLPTDYLSALKALTVEVEQKQLALAKIVQC